MAGLRGLPTVRPAVDLAGATIQVGGRSVALPAALPPGGTARIDALGRLTIWPGGMVEGVTRDLPGGPIVLAPGTHDVRFSVGDPTGYPGDVAIRLSRLRQIHPR